MGSGIGNRKLMQRLGEVLGIEDVKQAPQFLRTDELVPTISLDPAMAGLGEFQLFATGAIDGINSFGWMPIGPDAPSFTYLNFASTAYTTVANKEHVILGMRITVDYDAAGRNADAAAAMSLSLNASRQASSSTISLNPESYIGSWAIINNSNLNYVWSHPWWVGQPYLGLDPSPAQPPFKALAMNPVYVPAGSRYRLEVTREGAGNWPANTTASVYAYGVTVPKGMRPPGF